MSLHFIGQRFRGSVSRGGCWQCVPDCRCRLAEARTFSSVAYNKQIYEWKTQGVLHGPRGRVWLTEDKPEKGQYRRRQVHNPGSPEVPTRSISGYRVNHSASPDFRPFRD